MIEVVFASVRFCLHGVFESKQIFNSNVIPKGRCAAIEQTNCPTYPLVTLNLMASLRGEQEESKLVLPPTVREIKLGIEDARRSDRSRQLERVPAVCCE